ncbi:MAG: hypothetical protein J7L54_00325 [Elusimicrobia bacterium]|nr:hypothetical protein [Elusimicrobiota bacterium]
MKNVIVSLIGGVLVFTAAFARAAEELPVEMDAEILVEEPEGNVNADVTLESAEREIKEYCKQQKLSRKDEKEALKTLKELVKKEIPVETAAAMVSQAVSLKEVEKVCEEARKLADIIENCEKKERKELKESIDKAVEKGVPVGIVCDIAEGYIYQGEMPEDKSQERKGKMKGFEEEKGQISPADFSEALDVLSELIEKGIPVEHAKDVVEAALEDGKDVRDIAKDIDKMKEEIQKEVEEAEKEKPSYEELKETVTDEKMKEMEEEEMNLIDDDSQQIEDAINKKEQELIQDGNQLPDDGDQLIDDGSQIQDGDQQRGYEYQLQ